ncbi:MAG TPA: DUF2934 domain-containing protein [Gemmataceae bacterium]|nr:DUF2934 domain-containing protein [Gemmataceae bacterium]
MSRSTAPRVSPTPAPSTQKPMGHATPGAALSREKIAVRAYEKWCQRGRPCDGSDRQDWLAAEHELRAGK